MLGSPAALSGWHIGGRPTSGARFAATGWAPRLRWFSTRKPQQAIDRLASPAPRERSAHRRTSPAVAFLGDPVGGWIDGQAPRANGGII